MDRRATDCQPCWMIAGLWAVVLVAVILFGYGMTADLPDTRLGAGWRGYCVLDKIARRRANG